MPIAVDDGKERFYIHFESINGDIVACIFKVEDVRGVQYKYMIEVANLDEQRQIIWQGPVRNVRNYNDVKARCDYFFVKRNLAQLFSSSHCAGSIKLFITIQEVPFSVN